MRSREIANLVSLCDARHVTAIEFGLGDGVFTEMLADHFDDLTAVDGSQTAINLVRSKLSKANDVRAKLDRTVHFNKKV